MGGRLIMADKDRPQNFMTIPNLEVADSALNAYTTANKRQGSKSFKDGRRNFLKDIIVIMYTYGKYSKAKKYYKMLRTENPTIRAYRVSLDQFAIKEWKEDARDATLKQAYDLIGGMIYRSLYMAVAGEEDAAEGNLKLAKGLYTVYQKEHGTDDNVRTGLESFKEIKQAVTNAFKQSMGVKHNSGIVAPPDHEKIKMLKNIPISQKN